MPTAAILILILFSALPAAVLVFRPAITSHPGAKILAFGVLFFLPVFCLVAGVDSEMERSKSTAFCLSCHIMEPYGQNLHWTTQRILLPPTFKTIASLPTRPVTRVTPTTPCLEHSKQSWVDSGISTSTTFERNRLLKTSSCMSHTTTGNVCTAISEPDLLNKVRPTMRIQTRFRL